MRNFFNLYLIFFFTISTITGQNTDSPNLILSLEQESELNFYRYDPALKIKATLNSLDEVRTEFPEQLMKSIFSAQNQQWVSYNILGGDAKAPKKEQSHFDKIISMDKEKNYFELKHKLTFELGGILTSVIKFYFYQESEKPISGAYVLQKIDGRWYKTSSSSLSFLSVIIMRIKSKVLEGVISGNSTDQSIKALTQRVTTNGSLDVKKLEDEFASWYSPQKDLVKINLYKDPKSW